MDRGEFGSIAEQVRADFESLGSITPPGPKHLKMISKFIQEASEYKPIQIFAGSCPDYSHNGGRYTFTGLGAGVPLLSKYHLRSDIELLETFDRHNVPFTYTLMIADSEAIDEVFCDQFTDGQTEEFMSRCDMSMQATQSEIDILSVSARIKCKMRASSFFREFGKDKFIHFQAKYSSVINDLYATDAGIKTKIDEDLRQRRHMYDKMYASVLVNMDSSEQENFLRDRTVRTMAQYLTLGRLIREQSDYPVIVNHQTRNIGMFNMRNKFLLHGEIVGQQLPIPTFRLNANVY